MRLLLKNELWWQLVSPSPPPSTTYLSTFPFLSLSLSLSLNWCRLKTHPSFSCTRRRKQRAWFFCFCACRCGSFEESLESTWLGERKEKKNFLLKVGNYDFSTTKPETYLLIVHVHWLLLVPSIDLFFPDAWNFGSLHSFFFLIPFFSLLERGAILLRIGD